MTMQVSHLTKIRIIGMMVIMLVFSSRPAYAYEVDTHYIMTYVMCRAAGLSHQDALTVAQCDQGMDDSEATLANHGPGGVIPQPREEGLWHALPAVPNVNDIRDITATQFIDFYDLAKDVLTRKEEMFQTALNKSDRLRKLQYLGVFFHYQQDTWAHRKHYEKVYDLRPVDTKKFAPYVQPLGHAIDLHQPDRPPFDPECALRCLEEGISYVSRFMQALGEKPNKLFDDYTPAIYREDTNWPDKGTHAHQILIDASSEAHKFTTSLIRAQIDAYTFSIDARFTGRYTANEPYYGLIRENIQSVCQQFNIPEQIPAYLEPLYTLTTEMILAGETLPIPEVAEAERIMTIQSASNGELICAPNGIEHNQWLYCKKGTPVSFVAEGPLHACVLRVKGKELFFSYNKVTKAVKLWNTPEDASFSIVQQPNGTYALWSFAKNGYVGLHKKEELYLEGNPDKATGQWKLNGIPTFEKKTITIQSAATSKFICASAGLKHNEWLYCKDGFPAVSFELLGTPRSCLLKVKGQNLYLSYTNHTGAVKLWENPIDAFFSLEKQPNGTYGIRCLSRKYQYVWLKKTESPYIDEDGSPKNAAGQWRISGL